MKQLNKKAGELAQAHGVKAATDITGFSLLGHAWEMANASGVGFNIYWDMLPFVSGAKEYASHYSFPGGAYDNREFFGDHVKAPKSLAKEVAQQNIIVNCISPALVETRLVKEMGKEQRKILLSKIPVGRFGKTSEVAALVKFLVSDECTFSTGQCYDISGGRAVY